MPARVVVVGLVVATACWSLAARAECASPSEPGQTGDFDAETDLTDHRIHYGFLRRCTEGRPAILEIDLVEYWFGEDAVREAAKDGETLDIHDPVEYVRNHNPKLRRLRLKPDAIVRMPDCSIGCAASRAHLDDLPWDSLYRFQLQNGLIVYIELPYSP